MPVTIILPARFNAASFYEFIGAVTRGDGGHIANELVLDFARLSFIDGSGLTALCNTLEWLRYRGCQIEFHGYDRGTLSLRYLDDCGFFERYLGRKLNPRSSVRSTTLPFTPVSDADAHGWLDFRFTPWMASTLGVSHGALASVRAGVREVFNNIPDHSTQDIGFVHVQHYPNQRTVRITVSDFGRGIPASLRLKFPDIDDADAILRATEEGVTTKSTSRNMGMGLDVLVSNVARNHGRVTIHSLKGVLVCYGRSDGSIARVASLRNGLYPGTLVDICLPTDRFIGDDEEEGEVLW